MSRIIIASILLVLASPVQAQSPETLRVFDEGNAALLDGQFREAIAAYRSVEAEGWGSASLYYNMGLAYYRMDELGQAIRYLEKAKRLDRDDERIEHSLSVAERRRQDRFSQLPQPFWKNMQGWLVDFVPIRFAFFLGLLGWFGFAAAWVHASLTGFDTPSRAQVRRIALVVGGLLLIHALASSIWPPRAPQAVVLTPVVELREQASDGADVVQTIHEGLVVARHSQAGDWTLVEIPNGTRGWMASSSLGDI
ncbi:MAG: tetratricopeptide repeat protein [Bacteroidota bacterium]|nr:tetratricopeptide repeat protein [Bacteroidota bacterium]